MSQVNLLSCPICDPSKKDYPVRRPVNVTSEELVNLIQHVIENHSTVTPTKVLVENVAGTLQAGE